MTTILDLMNKKQNNQTISMVTCYDAMMAKIIATTTMDAILVGDSVAMVKHGHTSTVPATMSMMLHHVSAVARAAPPQLIVADLPFLSYRANIQASIEYAAKLMQAGAHALKLEGYAGNHQTIVHLVESGVPIMGHLGLTPQRVHQLGGFKVQGISQAQKNIIMDQAIALEQAGCFAVVLECMPPSLSQKIAKTLAIPCIGIGAGNQVDGQILVLDDLLGLDLNFKPKFVKQYLDGGRLIQAALNTYINEVQEKIFPTPQHAYAQKESQT
jgi:3-methyl-2-oxobutanoate hydroxymethyltransferase